MIRDCTLIQEDFRGWKAYTLSNDLVRVVAVPDIGGRIMAYDLGEYSYLFVDPQLAGKLFSPEENQGDGSLAAWKNYGGDKTWPSPQGWDTEDQWHGPPDPILDSGRYQVIEKTNNPETVSITMLSPADPRTGIQITRRVSLQKGSSRVAFELSFTNVSSQVKHWSIWDVVQLQAQRQLSSGVLAPEHNCSVTFPLNKNSRFEQGYWVMFGAADNPQWKADANNGLFIADYQYEIGKIGADSDAGWIAFSNAEQGYAFVAQFQYLPTEEYPDRGSAVECWTVGKGKVANLDYEHSHIYLMETEVLSPLYTFTPGEMHKFHLAWGACRASGKILDASEAGCTSERLTIQREGEGIRLSGIFGVFYQGKLVLTWLDSQSESFSSLILREVSPAELVTLGILLQPPKEACFVQLGVVAESDGNLRKLAESRLN